MKRRKRINPRYYTTEQAAAKAGYTVRTLWRRIKSRAFPWRQDVDGGLVLIPKKGFHKHLASRLNGRREDVQEFMEELTS